MTIGDYTHHGFWVLLVLVLILRAYLIGHKEIHDKEFRHQETCSKCKMIGWLKI